MKFVKMHGAGNDYIFVEAAKEAMTERLIIALCDRHKGVGGDGVVRIGESFFADAKMEMFNSDATKGAICGNALRCVAALIKEKTGKDVIYIETDSGVKKTFFGDDIVWADMGKPQFPFGEEITVFACGKAIKCTVVDVGNKHCVITGKADMKVAATLQRNGMFDNGVNVEFVTVTVDGLNVRVYERGSGETLSCGSGACAAVAACVRKKLIVSGKTKVRFRGGTLFVDYGDYLMLGGEAVKVFEGEYFL